MSEPKFTPGPWAFVPTEYLLHDAPGVQVAVANGGIIGGTEDDPHWVVQGADSIDWAPNANLIAAAPDLYEALAYLVENDRGVEETWAIADRALAKARGE